MRTKIIAMAVTVAATLAVFGRITLAQQDRYTLKMPDGLAFSEFKGYDSWQDVAVSETEGSFKAILGNPTMIGAYKKASRTMASLFQDCKDRMEEFYHQLRFHTQSEGSLDYRPGAAGNATGHLPCSWSAAC